MAIPRTTRAVLLLLPLLVPPEGRAADPALQWFHELPVPVASSFEVPLASRTLADGSVMVAGLAPSQSWFARRYEPGTGALLSAVMPHATEPLVDSDAMAIDAFGSLFVASETWYDVNAGDVWVMKYDGRTGVPVWPIPVRIRTQAAGADREDVPALVRVDAREDLIVVSAVGDSYANPYREMVMTKLDGRTGSTLWGPSTVPGGLLSLSDPELALDLDGNVVLTAASRNPSGNDRFVTLKIRGDTGAVAWGPATLDSGAIASSTPSALAVDRNGRVFVTGTRRTASPGSVDALTAAYDGQTGATLWGPVLYDGAAHRDDVGSRIAIDPAGNVFVAALSALASGSQTAVLKYSGPDGSILWESAAVSAGVATQVDVLVVDSAGDPIVATPAGTTYATSLRTTKLDGTTGNVSWEVPFVDPVLVVHRAVRVLVDPIGNPILVARTIGLATSAVVTVGYSATTGTTRWTARGLPGGLRTEPGSIDLDAGGNAVLSWPELRQDSTYAGVLAKYSPAGDRLWGPQPLEGSDGADAWVVKSVLDANGDVFAIGTQGCATSGCAWVVAKYRGATGGRLWGPVTFASGSSRAFDVAVDATGDVVVTGNKGQGVAATSDVATLKYDGATGAVLWGPVFLDGPAHDYDSDPRLALDPAGNVVVAAICGTGTPSNTAHGTCLVKYSALGGAVLWGPLISGTGGSSQPIDVAVDGSGDVLLLGSESTLSGVDAYLVKYRGGDGGVRWGPMSYVGGPNVFVARLVVDAAGDAVVAASPWLSHGERLDHDLHVLKYRGTTGALLWSTTPFDSGSEDYPSSLSLDVSGNVLLSTSALPPGLATLAYAASDGGPLFPPLHFPGGPNVSGNAKGTTTDAFFLSGSRYGRPFVARYGHGVAIDDFELPSGTCGRPYAVTFTARNGTPPLAWSIPSGSLPPGVTLNAVTGALTGVPSGQGLFMFRVRVTDGTSTASERDYQVPIADGSPPVPIQASQDPVCLGGSTTLSLDGTYATYTWLPGGETTPTLQATVLAETTYGVIVSDGTGCTRHGSIVLQPSLSQAPAAPSLSAPATVGAGSPNRVARAAAGPGASFSWTIDNGVITSGQGTSQVVFRAGSPGPLRLSVVAEEGTCRSAPALTTVNVAPRGSAVAFYTVEPCRVVDTRGPDGPLGGPALAPDPSTRSLAVGGVCGIPQTATSIAANITVTQAASAGHLRVFAADAPVPDTSTVNFLAGQTRANNATVPLSNDGLARIAVRNGGPGAVHVIIDVNGYYE